jgi:hypothetical protein
LSALPSGILALTLIAVPGAVATSALLPPNRMSLPGRLALTFGLGFSIVGVVSFGLALATVLSLLSLITTLALFTVGMAVVAIRRGAPRDRLRAVGAELRARPWQLLTGLAVLVAIAVARARLSPLTAIASDAPLRYWADGMDIASTGGIPEQSLQWGDLYAPSAMKMLMNSFSGAMSLVGGPEALPVIGVLMWISAVGLATTLWWLALELGFSWTAPLLPLVVSANNLLFGGEEISADLISYRAENFGRVIAFCALALAVHNLRAGREGGLPGYLVAGALIGVSSSFHLVPTFVALALLMFFAITFLVEETWKRSGRRWRHDAEARAAVAHLGAAGAVALLLAGSVVFMGRGDLALQGAGGTDAYAIDGREPDPTLLFVEGRRVPVSAAEGRAWYQPPGRLVGTFLRRATGTEVTAPWIWLSAGVVGAIVMIVFVPASLRPAATAALGLLAALLIVSLAFAYLYNLWAQANFGPRRLFDYASTPVYLLLLVLLEVAFFRLSRVRSWIPGGTLAVSAALLASMLLPPLRPGPGLIKPGVKTIRDLEWIRRNTPCDARLVSNRRTNATYQVLTGRVSVTEGMGPHLRPEMLGTIIDLLQRNQAFFRNPSLHRDYLEDEAIDHVVVVRGAGHGLRAVAGNPGLMDKAGFLRLVHKGERANVYEVVDPEQPDEFPDPANFPGFECRRDPIEL